MTFTNINIPNLTWESIHSWLFFNKQDIFHIVITISKFVLIQLFADDVLTNTDSKEDL